MLPGELLVVAPGGGSDDLAIDQQVDARLALVVAAADEKIEEPALDGKFRRSQFSVRPVLAQVRIDEPLAGKSAHLLLRRQRAARRALAKCLAFDGPLAVVLTLEISDDDRLARLRGRLGRFGRRDDHCQTVSPEGVVDEAAIVGGPTFQADAVFEPSGQADFDRRGGEVGDGVSHECRRQRRVSGVERDKGRKGLEGDLEQAGMAISDAADGISSGKGDFGPESRGVEPLANGLSIRLDLNRKTLIEGILGRAAQLIVVAAVAGKNPFVEDIPVAQAAVAGEIHLTGADSTDRHGDCRQGLARVGQVGGFGVVERVDPFFLQLLVGGHEVIGDVPPVERPGHGGQGSQGRSETGHFDERPPRNRPATAGPRLARS